MGAEDGEEDEISILACFTLRLDERGIGSPRRPRFADADADAEAEADRLMIVRNEIGDGMNETKLIVGKRIKTDSFHHHINYYS